MSNLISIEQKIQNMKKMGKNDLFYLCSRILGFSKMTESLHKRYADKFQEQRQKPIRLWLLPRSFYKTSLITVGGSIWCALNNPEERIMIGSAVLANAKDMVTEIGDTFVRNELFKQIYPEYCPANPKMPDTTWTKSQIELPNRRDVAKMEKTFEAHGSDTAVVSRHYTRMFFDDLVSPGNFETPELRKKILNYFKACLSLKESPETPIDVIGTHWHDDDLYCELKKWPNVEVIQMPAIYIEGGIRKSIFPEVYPISVLDELKQSQGSYLFSALYMLNPVPEELQVFKSAWWVHYDWMKGVDEISGYQRMRREDDGEIVTVGKRFMCCDVAKSEGKGDYSTAIVITTDSENNWYILDMWRGQVLPMAHADKILDMAYYWFPNVIGIETVAYQLMLKLYLEEKMRREGFSLPVEEINPSNKISKELKIKSLQPLFESKTIYLPRNHELTPILKEEFERFPSGKNDDLADTLSMFREMVFPSTYQRQKSKDPNSLDSWKDKLKKWKKDKNKFFLDHELNLKRLQRSNWQS